MDPNNTQHVGWAITVCLVFLLCFVISNGCFFVVFRIYLLHLEGTGRGETGRMEMGPNNSGCVKFSSSSLYVYQLITCLLVRFNLYFESMRRAATARKGPNDAWHVVWANLKYNDTARSCLRLSYKTEPPWAVRVKKGPNDAQHVLWGLGVCVKFISSFFLYIY